MITRTLSSIANKLGGGNLAPFMRVLLMYLSKMSNNSLLNPQ